MIRGWLLDEHLPPWWRRALVERGVPGRVWRIGDLDAPPFQSPDIFLLRWCEENECVLLTNNRQSMPEHLAAHVSQGGHVQGIFVVDPATVEMDEFAQELILIIEASFENEYQDQIRFLPII